MLKNDALTAEIGLDRAENELGTGLKPKKKVDRVTVNRRVVTPCINTTHISSETRRDLKSLANSEPPHFNRPAKIELFQ